MICTTITEAMERNKGNYIGVEVYEYDTNDPYYKKLHTDFTNAYGVSFDDIYSDPNGKVLVLMLEHGWDDED